VAAFKRRFAAVGDYTSYCRCVRATHRSNGKKKASNNSKNGNAYLAVSGRGTGAFVQKYSPSGALLWSRLDSTGGGYAMASSLALSPDGDVAVTSSVLGGASWITSVHDATTGARPLPS